MILEEVRKWAKELSDISENDPNYKFYKCVQKTTYKLLDRIKVLENVCNYCEDYKKIRWLKKENLLLGRFIVKIQKELEKKNLQMCDAVVRAIKMEQQNTEVAIKIIKNQNKHIARLEANIKRKDKALKKLTDEYLMKQGTKHQFVACIAFLPGKYPKYWQDALDAQNVKEIKRKSKGREKK